MEKNSIDELVQRVYSIFNQLNAQSDLRPNDTVASLFSSLVDLALNSDPSTSKKAVRQLKLNGKLQDIIDLCCASEIELERYWADKIINGEKDLREFPYYRNYVQLTDFELQQISRQGDLKGKKMLFVGNGAVPLSAIMFKQNQPSLQISCIDRDYRFVEYARQILLRLGINDIYVESHDINELDPLVCSEISKSDVLFIAALVGNSNEQKNHILNTIHPYVVPGSIIAVRSVPDDLRRLLYPKFELGNLLRTKYRALGEYSLPRETGVINSLVILSSTRK